MKTKFYFFTLFLLLGFGKTIHAQSIHLDVENFTTGGDGTNATAGNVLVYTINVTSSTTASTGTVIDNIPGGTAYQPGSTVVNGVAVADVNNTMPFAAGNPVSLSANTTIVFRVMVTANIGTITNTATLQVAGIPDMSDIRSTLIATENSCNKIYTLTARNESGIEDRPRQPKVPLPYQYIRTMNPSGPSYEDIYDGPTGPCYEAPTPGNAATLLAAGSILTDATAMAVFPHFYRIYFVNRSTGGVAADLCYINIFDQGTSTAVAYRYTGIKLASSATSEITRMAFDAAGTGYALTEDGQQFIRFTIDYWAGTVPTISTPVSLTPDISNGTHNFFAETGGDICSDGSGKLFFIPNSGNVYVIDPAINVVKYVGSISNMPAGGCRSVALDATGYFYIGGFYQAVYKVALSTLTATQVTGITAYATTDFGSCGTPISNARVGTNITGTNPAVPRISEVFAKVQPNPFHNVLNLQVQLNTTEEVRVQLIDFFGRTVYTTSQKMSTGVNSLQLPVPADLGTGVYVVELWAGDKRLLQKKLVKQ